MSVVVAEGVVEVTADASGVPKQVAKDVDAHSGEAKGAGEGLGKSLFGGILGGFALIGGAAAVTGFVTDAIGKASDLNETISKSNAIFGKQASSIESWANTAATKVGLSKSAALDAAAGFGDMFSQIGFTGDAAAEMSKSVVQASADLGSFSNLDTADVSDRIAAAFRGEYDSLQAVIPNINAARVEQEALAETGKKSASQLTAQEKATAVLAIVQKDGKRAMGDFERTSSGAANTQKILTAQLEDQSTRIGTMLLPAWQAIQGFFATAVLPAFTWLIDNMPVVAAVIGAVGGILLVALAPAIWAAVTATWAWTAALLANPMTWIVLAIVALVAGITWLATKTTFFQDLWKGAMDVIGAAIDWLWNSVINPVIQAIAAAWNWLYTWVINPIIQAIVIYIKIWAAIFTWLWQNIISPAIAGIGAAFNWVWKNVIKPVADWISGAIKTVGDVVRTVFGAIGTVIGNGFKTALNVIKAPINGIIGLINGVIDGLNAIRVTIPDWVPGVGGQTWGIKLGHIPQLAEGGTVWRSGTVLVGERGPELLNLPAGASVHPLDKGKGGGSTTIIVYESTDPLGSAGRVAKELRQWRAA